MMASFYKKLLTAELVDGVWLLQKGADKDAEKRCRETIGAEKNIH